MIVALDASLSKNVVKGSWRVTGSMSKEDDQEVTCLTPRRLPGGWYHALTCLSLKRADSAHLTGHRGSVNSH